MTESSDEDVDVGLEDLELEATFARLFASGAPPSDEEISKHLDLTSNKVSVSFSFISLLKTFAFSFSN